MLYHIAPDAEVRTDRWSGNKGLESEFPKLIRDLDLVQWLEFQDENYEILIYQGEKNEAKLLV